MGCDIMKFIYPILKWISVIGIALILIFALLITSFYFSWFKDQKPPVIQTGEFPFKVTYEVNGETFTIEDTVICTYNGLDHSAWFGKPRTWNEYLKSRDEEKTVLLKDENVNSVLKTTRIDDEIRVVLHYGMGAYYMGDPNAKSLIHGKPHICYSEKYTEQPSTIHYESTKLSKKDLEKYFGIKILEFQFSKPIKNTFK